MEQVKVESLLVWCIEEQLEDKAAIPEDVVFCAVGMEDTLDLG